MGPLSASQPPLVNPPVVILASVPSMAEVAVAATLAAALSDSSRSAASSACSYEQSLSHRSPGPCLVFVRPDPGLWGFPVLSPIWYPVPFPGPVCHQFPFMGHVFYPVSVAGPVAYPRDVFGAVVAVTSSSERLRVSSHRSSASLCLRA